MTLNLCVKLPEERYTLIEVEKSCLWWLGQSKSGNSSPVTITNYCEWFCHSKWTVCYTSSYKTFLCLFFFRLKSLMWVMEMQMIWKGYKKWKIQRIRLRFWNWENCHYFIRLVNDCCWWGEYFILFCWSYMPLRVEREAETRKGEREAHWVREHHRKLPSKNTIC